MSRVKRIFCLLMMAVSASATANDDKATQANTLMLEFFQHSGAPGLAISVGIEDRVVWSAGYGYADLEQLVPVDAARTKFRIGSVAKAMTAYALGLLVQEDKIDLDKDARYYVSSFPEKTYAFTLRQLAGHLAGIRHYRSGEAYLRTNYPTVEAGLEIFKDDPLVAVPGESWRYSSYGYNLLSVAMEQAAGTDFPTLMTTRVFAPLGMDSTVPDRIEQIIPYRGRYYHLADGTIQNEPEVDNSFKWASGAFLSTTEDMARFGLDHFDSALLDEKTIAMLWEPQQTGDGEFNDYGIGWRKVVDENGLVWVGHGGGAIGGTASLWLFPEDEMVIALASNLTELDISDILVKVREVFASP